MKNFGLAAAVFLFACGGHKPAPVEPAPGPEPAPPAPVAETKPEPAPPPAPPAPKSLYDRLGGKPAVTAVVEEFVARTTTDDQIKDRFFNVDADNLKKQLVDFVCMAGGGGCQYTGKDMQTAHAGMDLSDDEFTALVNDLAGALDKFKVPDKEKGELLGALAPLKPQIVAPADHLKPMDDKKLAPVTKLADKQKDDQVKHLLTMAVTAGKRGQRSYAEQLFTRAEMITGAPALASVAGVFRAGAPTRITTKPTQMKDEAPQPKLGASSDADIPATAKPEVGQLHGTMKIDGKAPSGLGVVMLTPEKGGGGKRVAKERVIEQRGKAFEPHVMAVPVGSTVSFPNFDPIFHNVFSLSKTKPFDLGMYKNGETRELKFDKPGIVRLGCNLHANMSAYLIVVDAPHYAVVDTDGSFTFKSLKPGKYKVSAWNEASGDPTMSTVEIKDGANETELDLKAGAGPAIGPDKFGQARQ